MKKIVYKIFFIEKNIFNCIYKIQKCSVLKNLPEQILYRYAQVSYDEGKFHKMLCNDYWQMVASISKRLQNVDFLHLIMCKYTRVLTEYFTELRTTACMLVFLQKYFYFENLN